MIKESDNRNVSLTGGLWINDRDYNIRILAVMMALEVLLAYSPFGYVVLPGISVTTLFIGVLIAALWGGPISGAMVGLIFGLTSMWKASVTAVNPNDLIFSPIRSGNPMGSVILALAPRILFGILAGLVYYVVMKLTTQKSKARLPILLMVTVVLERMHSMLTYLFMDKVFHAEGASMWKAWTHLLSGNRIKTFIVAMVFVACAYLLFDRYISKKYYEQFIQIKDIASNVSIKYSVMTLVTVVVITLCAVHLWERIRIVLFDIDQLPPEIAHIGLIAQVLFQFVAASVSAVYVVTVIYRHARNVEEVERRDALLRLDLEKENAKEMELRALKDPLTGVFNRKGLEKVVAEENFDGVLTGFALIDIDYFKEINDTCGHDAGDTILKETVRMLLQYFGKHRVFRLGGDEFAVLIRDDQKNTQESLQQKWDAMVENYGRMHDELSALLPEDVPVSFSVGVCFSESGFTEKLYPLADSALYETKSNGRAGCTMVDSNGKVLLTWKDPKAKTNAMLSELKHIGVCRIVYSLDGTMKPQMFCNENLRNLMCVPAEASSEECYEIWTQGISSESQDDLAAVRKTLWETGMTEYSYVWNHPVRGKICVESCASGKIENGIVFVISHHQLIMNQSE